MFLSIKTPVPNDIPLELPLPEWLLVVLLIVSFLAHIVFVNVMVGGSILTLWGQIKGLKNKDYDVFAHEVAKTITVNKSIAVVLGVAPLLCINTLYTVYFYSANALTGLMWILIIPLVTIAFLLTYLHKYTWERLEDNKWLHISIMGLSVALFLFIPLIFLVNVNLMLFPEKWQSIQGFLSALTLPNVLPRYFHFLCSSLAVTGLFVVWYNKRKNYPVEEIYTSLTRYGLKRIGYNLALGASVAQFLIGPIVAVSLPAKGYSWGLFIPILCGVAVAVLAVRWLWKAVTGPKEDIDKNFGKIVLALTITVVFMGSGRHMYRATALAPHQKLVAAKTKEFQRLSEEARTNAANAKPVELVTDPSLGEVAKGAAIFKQNCTSCHKEREKLVGPPMTEMVSIYENDPEGLKKWINAPGKKRADFPQMPAFAQLSDDDLTELSKYILSIKK
jgi:cytochrome c